ncbi:MAG: hypothetical protein Q8M15_03790 [Bacteroidota bacterium]|nr:hypothetical protein [Bacteroidota bacterium]
MHSKTALLITSIFIFTLNLSAQSNKGKQKKDQNISTSTHSKPNEIFPGGLCGAELYYKFLSEKEIEIFLVKYFYCTEFKIDSAESVTVQEGIINMVTAKPVLKLVSIKDSTHLQNLNCPGYKNGCVKKVVYSGKVNIMSPMMGGYDITWGFCCWDEFHMTNIQGIQEFQKQGLSLTIHIPELNAGELNAAPVFMMPPVLSTCKNQLIAINASAMDDDRDSLGYRLSALYNYKTENGIAYPEEPKFNPGSIMNTSFAGGRPPFKKILYKKGFNPVLPMGGKQIEIDSKTGEIQLKADSIGEYLIGVTVTEYRLRKPLGSCQRVFKVQVVD